MHRGFRIVIAAQFVSALADNALLLVAIARLGEAQAALWMVPLLKITFTLSYVVFAPLAGPFADSMPKGRVMMLANATKIAGCLLMVGLDPLLAFAVVGLGAAAYSPAKYGLVTELLPPAQLVRANGWIEITTVGAIILGTALGGALVSSGFIGSSFARWLHGTLGGAPTALLASLAVVLALYALAALINAAVPDSGAEYPDEGRRFGVVVAEFAHANAVLWRDPLGRVSLAVTTLFWGIGATLQLLVLRWAQERLGLGLDHAAYLQGVSAVGVAVGALVAGRWVPLRRATAVLPVGIAIGLLVPVLAAAGTPLAAALLLTLVGALAGFFVVPMNALLQHRGHVLLSAGRSIAVQNFNENTSVLAMLGLYALLLALDVSALALAWGLGALVVGWMLAVLRLHRRRPPVRGVLAASPQEGA